MQIYVKLTDIVYAHGHENVTSTNLTTFEITKETHLTTRGNCIIAVGADKGAADLSSNFKKMARREDAKITIVIEAGRETESVVAWGSPQLRFSHPTDLVVRKSDFVCGRTLAICSDKAAKDLSKKLIEKLRNPDQGVKITLTAGRII
jgi:hypothetical protein